MAAGDLVTLAQAQAWLGVTSDPLGIAAALISSCSTQIQNWIGYQLVQTTYTRTFNGLGGPTMLLPDRPVVSVSSVTVDGISIPQATASTTPGFLNDDKFCFITKGGKWSNGQFSADQFMRGFQNVTITYTAGYTTIPVDIQQACLLWIAQCFSMVGENPSVKRMRAGDTEIDFQLTTVVGKTTLLIPPIIASILQPYKRVGYSTT